jgi:LSD1 subclass zinc finger protein
MTIHIACPHCRQPLSIPAAAQSATIQCPHCQGLARVPKVSDQRHADVPPKSAPAPPRDPALNPWAGITAMVVGITGLVFSCVPGCGAPLCVIAVVFGWIGLRQYKAGRGMATAGLVLGACGIALSVVITIVLLLSSAGPTAVPTR